MWVPTASAQSGFSNKENEFRGLIGAARLDRVTRLNQNLAIHSIKTRGLVKAIDESRVIREDLLRRPGESTPEDAELNKAVQEMAKSDAVKLAVDKRAAEIQARRDQNKADRERALADENQKIADNYARFLTDSRKNLPQKRRPPNFDAYYATIKPIPKR